MLCPLEKYRSQKGTIDDFIFLNSRQALKGSDQSP